MLTDIELDYLQRMVDVEWNFDSWVYGQYSGGCSFNTEIDNLYYNLYYCHTGFQITISNIERTSRLAIRLNDVAGWDVENKKVLYRNKVYSTSCGCIILDKDEIPEETYNLVQKVLNKLETHKDTWKKYHKDE